MDKMVVLDGFTLNPGDLRWDVLEELGDVTIYDRTNPGDVVERCKDAKFILTNKVVLDDKILSELPKLKYIGVMATGYNVVDVEACNRLNITVTNVSGYSTPSVVQHTFALILELYSRVGEHDSSVKNGDWHKSKDFAYTLNPIYELAGKTLGVIGLGDIGKGVIEVAKVFKMNIISNDRGKDKRYVDGIDYVSMGELFKKSDIVTLHCPLTDENEGFVNSDLIGKMKSTALIINTGRGPLINHDALNDALEDGSILGAGIDVYVSEPPKDDHPVFKQKKCIITPHIAWATTEARTRLFHGVVNNIKAFNNGKPENVVTS